MVIIDPTSPTDIAIWSIQMMTALPNYTSVSPPASVPWTITVTCPPTNTFTQGVPVTALDYSYVIGSGPQNINVTPYTDDTAGACFNG